MSIRQLSMLLLAIAVVGIAAWLLVPKTQAQERTPADVWQAGGPHKLIENAARSVSADNETAVRSLTDAISAYPHVFGSVPADVGTDVKEALTQAELSHLRGALPGVKEEDIANLVNMWADRLHLPPYAKTSPKQVRALRMSMAVSSPIFMGKGLSDPNRDLGNAINPEMSPLQAAHLATVLLDQKFLDPDYQVSPQEWEQHFHEKEIQKLKRQQELRKSLQSGIPAAYLIGSRSNPKHDEMRQAFSKGVSRFTSTDTSDLINSSLAMLGIKK